MAWALAAKGRVVCDEHGKPVRVIGVPRDVTARKRADQRLAVQYEITRTLAECATLEEAAPRILRTVCECLGWVHGGLWRVDPIARVLRCVENACEVGEGWPGEWKVEVISTPTTIWRDLQGQRFTTSRSGRDVPGKMPEEQLLALIGRLDALAS